LSIEKEEKEIKKSLGSSVASDIRDNKTASETIPRSNSISKKEEEEEEKRR
jgi:hypothetical protein